MTPHIISASFGDYVLLFLLLCAPFVPLAVRIIGDYLHDGPKESKSKAEEAPEPIM